MTSRVVIRRARVWEVALPLVVPFRISGGVLRTRRSLIVELATSDGATGYGESAPFELPFYSSETLESARWMLTEVLLPRLVGRSLSQPMEADAVLREGVRGNPFARAGAETAVWDLFAHASGSPLIELLTGVLRTLGVDDRELAPRDHLACGVALGIPDDESPATLARWTREALDRGYRRVKIKIRPGWDVEPIRATQAAIATQERSVPLWADANASYDLDRDAAALRGIDDERLLFIEQPLRHDDLVDHAKLARRLRTPICLDESLRDAQWARHAVTLGSSRIWNVKIQRVGGIAEALRIYAVACTEDVALWGGTMPETGVGAHPIMALGALPRFVYASDVEPSDRWFSAGGDLIALAMRSDGTMAVPRVPGLATTQVGDRLESLGTLVWERS
ncbi:MAG: o-succinylbenzoate synthase [Gemmatimonadaceae bacterium]